MFLIFWHDSNRLFLLSFQRLLRHCPASEEKQHSNFSSTLPPFPSRSSSRPLSCVFSGTRFSVTPAQVASTELTFTRCSGQRWPPPKSLLPDFSTPDWCRTLTRAGRASTWARPWLAGPVNPSTTTGSWWKCSILRSRKDPRRPRGTGGGTWGSADPFTRTKTRGRRPDRFWWPTATTGKAQLSCIRTERSGRRGEGRSSAGSSTSARTAGDTLFTWTSATWAGMSGSWRRRGTTLSTATASVPSRCRTIWTPPITPSSRRWWTRSIPTFPEPAASRQSSAPYRCCTWTSTRKSFLKTIRTWWWRAVGADESYISPQWRLLFMQKNIQRAILEEEKKYIWIYLCWLKKKVKINILMRVLAFSSGFEDVFFFLFCPMYILKWVQLHMKYNAQIFMMYLLHNHFICKWCVFIMKKIYDLHSVCIWEYIIWNQKINHGWWSSL